ncbi:MAG: hypothetical protein HYV29_02470 [Ignavibacteriales bacterium]|nr:hypothetical protein [Ignavibacteriales bacterium]
MSFNKANILVGLFFIVVTAHSQLAGTAGVATRLGFGARGMGMGNAMIAVLQGENSGYYNPASVKHLDGQYASLSYGALSLDRNLNALFYGQPIDTNAGVSVRILNTGVSDIDGRDIDGFHTETYSTSENQFSLSFALKIRKITLGLSTKIYYYSLFKDLSSTGLGFDVGALYSLSPNIVVGAVIKDLNAKYRWDSSPLYDELGNTTTDKFPVRRALGISYTLNDRSGVLSVEFENSNRSTSIIRFGAEYIVNEYLTLRSGLDGWDLDDPKQAHPAFGITVRTDINNWNPAFTYAYVVEPYNVFAMHIIALSIKPCFS